MSSEPRDQYLAVCDELQRVVAERDALKADLAAARALLADAEIMLQECEPWLDQYANSAKLKADTQKVRLRIVDALAGKDAT